MSHHTHDKPAHSEQEGYHTHDDHHGSFWGHAKLYFWIGVVLVACTGLTVWLSYVDMGTNARNWLAGMALATFKVCLVGAIFMHLKGEVKTIWRPLFFTFAFVAALFLLFAFAHSDPIPGTSHPLP